MGKGKYLSPSPWSMQRITFPFCSGTFEFGIGYGCHHNTTRSTVVSFLVSFCVSQWIWDGASWEEKSVHISRVLRFPKYKVDQQDDSRRGNREA